MRLRPPLLRPLRPLRGEHRCVREKKCRTGWTFPAGRFPLGRWQSSGGEAGGASQPCWCRSISPRGSESPAAAGSGCANGLCWARCTGEASSRAGPSQHGLGNTGFVVPLHPGTTALPVLHFCLLPPGLLHLRGTHYVVCVEQRDVLVPAVVMNPASPVLETRGGTASAPS